MEEVATELSISDAQVYALVRGGDLPAIKIGGRGQWRVERSEMEAFVARPHDDTATFIREHPFGGNDVEQADEPKDED